MWDMLIIFNDLRKNLHFYIEKTSFFRIKIDGKLSIPDKLKPQH